MDAMNYSKTFRFLDLPAELRNRIYSIVFEHANEHPVELCHAQSSQPEWAVTLVSHQLRNESYRLYKRAKMTYWQSHDFIVAMDHRGSRIRLRETQSETLALPFANKIQNLSFILQSNTATTKIHAKISGRDDVDWTLLWAPTNARTVDSLERHSQRCTDIIRRRREQMLLEQSKGSRPTLDIWLACKTIFPALEIPDR